MHRAIHECATVCVKLQEAPCPGLSNLAPNFFYFLGGGLNNLTDDFKYFIPKETYMEKIKVMQV